jgi:hypothetical protein
VFQLWRWSRLNMKEYLYEYSLNDLSTSTISMIIEVDCLELFNCNEYDYVRILTKMIQYFQQNQWVSVYDYSYSFNYDQYFYESSVSSINDDPIFSTTLMSINVWLIWFWLSLLQLQWVRSMILITFCRN